MPIDQTRRSAVDLREFVKAENERLYNFCLAVLEEEGLAEDVLLETFEKFVRKESKRSRRAEWEDEGTLRIALYQLAWERAQRALMGRTFTIEAGRDTRGMDRLGEDILKQNESPPEVIWKRLCFVDTEFRVPMVLRDLLGFQDDEVMEILGSRWGVYRHRLHRGRMDFLQLLQGGPAVPTHSQSSTESHL